MFGGLTTVTMPRPDTANSGTVTQTRTFSWNTGEQLLSVTHPESGTVSYGYNNDGSTQPKFDAKGHPEFVRKFTGASETTEDTCAKVSYQYGTQGVDGGFSGANLQGRFDATGGVGKVELDLCGEPGGWAYGSGDLVGSGELPRMGDRRVSEVAEPTPTAWWRGQQV